MSAEEEARATCPSCGEELALFVDLLAGEEQELVEDCRVCCRPIVFLVRVERDGTLVVRAEAE
jgi:hypothetical protein